MRARRSSESSSSLMPYPAANSRPCGSRPRSSANSRNTTRIITVTAASYTCDRAAGSGSGSPRSTASSAASDSACTSSSTARRTWTPSASVISSAAATDSRNISVSRSSGLPPTRRRRDSSSTNALRVAGSSTHVCASTTPDATIVSGRALTIAHQRPSVTTPTGTVAARSSSSIRSIGLVAQPSVSGSRSESTGSTTSTSAPVDPPWVSAPTLTSGGRTSFASVQRRPDPINRGAGDEAVAPGLDRPEGRCSRRFVRDSAARSEPSRAAASSVPGAQPCALLERSDPPGTPGAP